MMKRPDDWDAMRRRAAYEPPDDGRNHGAMFQLVHPQWGGYCFPCVVEFDTDGGHRGNDETRADLPCFEVHEFHDGEFPTDHVFDTRHYCAAEQLVRFGLDVIELQVEHCDRPTSPSIPWLEEMASRIDKLLNRARDLDWTTSAND